jgi:hypothetical protein
MDWYHSRRALCVIQRQLDSSGITIYYDPPSVSIYRPENWWQSKDGRVAVLGELAKIGYYWWHYDLAPSCG